MTNWPLIKFRSLWHSIQAFRKAKVHLLIFSVTLLFVFFGLVVPVGTGPDSGAHSVMTYCSAGNNLSKCQFLDSSRGIIYRKVSVPQGVSLIGSCQNGVLQSSAACSEPYRSKLVTSFKVEIKKLLALREFVLFSQNMGKYNFEIKSLSQFGKIYLNSTFANQAYLKDFDLLSFMNNRSCNWPCTASSSNSEKSSFALFTIIPSTASRTFDIYINGYIAFSTSSKVGPPPPGSLASGKVSPEAMIISANELKTFYESRDKFKQSVYFTDNYEPRAIPWIFNQFISKSIHGSLVLFRIFTLLIMVFTLYVWGLALRFSNLFYRAVLALVISAVPYGFYIYSTNSTSSLSWLGVLTVGLIPTLLANYQSSSIRTLLRTFVLLVWGTFLASARVDGMYFSLAGFIAISFVFLPARRLRVLWGTVLFSLIIITSFMATRYKGTFSIHATKTPLALLHSVSLHNALEIPGVLFGLLGARGPLNIWGLGSLDVPLPSVCAILAIIGVSGIFWNLKYGRNLRLLTSFIILFFLMYIPFALTLSSYHVAAGGWMMPRYGLSPYGLLILLAALVFDPFRNKAAGSRNSLNLGIWIPLLATSIISLYVTTEKYMNGLLIDYKDAFLPSVAYLGDWVPRTVVRYRGIDLTYGWQPYLLRNPYVIFIIFACTMTLVATLVQKGVSKDIE